MEEIPVQLIVGLGNPGPKYEKTRHNAGVWFVRQLCQDQINTLIFHKKFNGLYGQADLFGQSYHVLFPQTYMNHSGQAVNSLIKFYKIPPKAVLIAHDDLDLPAGVARFKQGGGAGGHKGLMDIIAHIGDDFNRVRIGIGHPAMKEEVMSYVLNCPMRDEQKKIDFAIHQAISALSAGLSGDWQKAMNELHGS
jgi:PTH1 family peptidyl-tRNA hydrolase